MNNYHDNEVEGFEDLVLDETQRRGLQSMQAPEGLGDRIQHRLASLHPVVQRIGLRQLSAAGLLGFLSFFGAQMLLSQLGPSLVKPVAESASASESTENAVLVTDYHLSGVALLSDSDYYVDTLRSSETTPEVILATYMHERGAQR